MITQDRDLRTAEPVWNGYKKPRIPTLPIPAKISTDALVIGSGITGAMAAESLTAACLNVVIVDKRKALGGSTAASTALLQYEIDTPLIHLMEKMGQEKARRVWMRSKLALENLAMKVHALGIDCTLERRDSLYLAGNILNAEDLERECAARNMLGLSSDMRNKSALKKEYGLRGDAAILSYGNLSCNPVQLTSGFLNVAIERGAKLYAPLEVTQIHHRKNDIRVETDQGVSIDARYIVFATGYEIPHYIKTRKHKIHSTYALATKPVKSIPRDLPMFWEAADPYIYGRAMPDGRIIFGGGDEEFSDSEKRNALLPEKQKMLERKLKNLMPDHAFETDYMWTGSFGGSTTGTPSMGAIPNQKNCYAVMAYGGNGITFSRMAADMITAAIMGVRDPDQALFSFQ